MWQRIVYTAIKALYREVFRKRLVAYVEKSDNPYDNQVVAFADAILLGED